MSNNDNIYNILNNFNKVANDTSASTDTSKAKTKLHESMEQVVNEKYMGFKKTVAAVKKGGSAEDPEAVAAAIGRKKYGKEKFQKAAAAGKKLNEKAVNPYAVGMAAAKKKAGITAKPAHDLPKKVIKKAHEIAKKIDEQSVSEATSAAVRMQRAAERQRAKSDASLARTPSSIPKKEKPKKQGVDEAKKNPDTFVGKKVTYKEYGITQEGPHQWGISSSSRKFSTLNAAKRHIDKNLIISEAMPASVIKAKEKIRQMTADEKKAYFKGKSKEQLQKMARSHGYGENSNVYAKYVTESISEAGFGRNRGYSHGFASPHAPSLGGGRRNKAGVEMDAEEWFIVKDDGKMYKVSIFPTQRKAAEEQGYSPTKEQAKAKAGQQGMTEAQDYHVYFEVDSENAYNHVMDRFGSVIDWEGDIMVAPRKYWKDILELAYAAGGEAIEVGDEQGLSEGYDDEELANEVYAQFEMIYPNLARRANERTVHAAIMDVLNYGGDSDPGALAQDVARAVKLEMQQGVVEGANDTIYPNAEVIKSKNGKPVGEIYQDGNSWGCFHYRADRGYDMIDSREDAIEALKDLHQETGRGGPDYTIKGVAESFDSAAFDRHMDKLRAQKELEKTDPMRALVNKMHSDDAHAEKLKRKPKPDDERKITDPFHSSQGVNIGQKGVTEGMWDRIKGAAKDLGRDSTQKMIKHAWDTTYWPKHIEPALNQLVVGGKPFNKMVLDAPRAIENASSDRGLLKQYTMDLVFAINPQEWDQGDAMWYLERALPKIEKQSWNQGGLVSFDSPRLSFKHSKTDVQDLIIPVRLSSLESNVGNISEQGVTEGSNDYFKRRKDEEDRIAGTKPPAKRTPKQTDYAKRRAQEKKSEQGMSEGMSDVIKGVKRLVKGKSTKGEREIHHTLKAIGAAQGGGSEQEIMKHVNRHDKVKNLGQKGMSEGFDDMIKDVNRKAKEKGTGKFDKKEISTGTVYTRKYNSKSGETDDTENVSVEKRGRGRPKKSAFESTSTIDKMIADSLGELLEAEWRSVDTPVTKEAANTGSIRGGVWTATPPKAGTPGVAVPQGINEPSTPASKATPTGAGSIRGGVWTATPPKAGRPGVAVPQGLDEVDAEMEGMRKMAGLKGGQKKLDRDHDGKLTATDFDMLRKGLEEEIPLDDVEEGNAFSGAVAKAKADGAQPGETFTVGGKEYDLREGDDTLNQMRRIAGLKECGMSPIGGGAGDMRDEQGSMNISTNQSSDGTKSVNVSASGDAASSLMQMLKLAGMGEQSHEDKPQGVMVVAQDSESDQEQEMEEEKDPRYQASTTPDEQVAPVQALTKGGNGDVAGKEKKMKPGGYQFGDNNLAMQESLGSQLMKEYNSIKVKK